MGQSICNAHYLGIANLGDAFTGTVREQRVLEDDQSDQQMGWKSDQQSSVHLVGHQDQWKMRTLW